MALSTLLTLAGHPVQANDSHAEDDLGLWLPVTLTLPVTQRVRASLQVEPRLRNNIRDMGLLMVLPTVDVKLNDVVSVQAGYGWYPSFDPKFRNEHRMIQQVTLQKPFGKLKTSLRSRIEERFIADTRPDVSIRNRHMLRLEHPLRDSKWYVVGYDEFFVNLNSVEHGPQAGFDQNRLFAGLGRYVNPHTAVEGGYQLVYANRSEPTVDRMTHVILLRLNMRLR